VILKRNGNLGRRDEEGLHFSAARLHEEGRKEGNKLENERRGVCCDVWNVGGVSGGGLK
jgi:hypothetical protein